MTATTEDVGPFVPRRPGRVPTTDHRAPDLTYVQDEALRKQLTNVERLRKERRIAHDQLKEAEAGLRRAADEDRDLAATAIRRGSKVPRDERSAAAAIRLTEAQKTAERTTIAWEQEVADLEKTLPTFRDAELASLGARIEVARAEAAATIDILRSQLVELERLRDAEHWFKSFPRLVGVRKHTQVDGPLAAFIEYVGAQSETISSAVEEV